MTITADESKKLRSLFCKKRKQQEPPGADVLERRQQSEQSSVPSALSSRSHRNAGGKCSAKRELEGETTVTLLTLDQIIPKRTKDGPACIFGKTARESTVAVWVHGFTPYFFFPAAHRPSGEPMSADDVDQLRKILNQLCADKTSASPVVSIAVEERTEAMYYRASGRPFLRIHVEVFACQK